MNAPVSHAETFGEAPICGTVLWADPTACGDGEIARELRRLGHNVHVVGDIASAWRCVQSEQIRFVLLELRFAKLASFKLIQLISRLRPRCRIVVYSSFCNIASTVSAVRAGADDVLPKPLSACFVVGILLGRGIDSLSGEGSLTEPKVVLRDHIISIYSDCNFNLSRTAKRLAMHRRSLERYLKRNQLIHQKLRTTAH
ncbi:response regulator transcription factor [Rhizobium calliandrae]|uniref:response regulator transcription factor n=1 Tax=Rhizobium calliandrae TaxID=1312182 RepID=UPI003D80AFAD